MAYFSEIADRQETFIVTTLLEIKYKGPLLHLYLGEVQDLFPENVPEVIYSPEQAKSRHVRFASPIHICSLYYQSSINTWFLFVTTLNRAWL